MLLFRGKKPKELFLFENKTLFLIKLHRTVASVPLKGSHLFPGSHLRNQTQF